MKKSAKLSTLLLAGAMTMGIVSPAISTFAAQNGKWMKDGYLYWYRFDDGSFAKKQWLKVNGKWYYFDGQGYMVRGPYEVNGTWYMLDEDNGHMRTG